MSKVHFSEKFEQRHNGPSEAETAQMLTSLGVDSIDQLIDQTVPSQIRAKRPLSLPPALSETAYLKKMRVSPRATRYSNPISARAITT